MASNEQRRLTELTVAKMEEVAREEATRTGFNMQTEPHALFRMLAVVFTTPHLKSEALRRVKESLCSSQVSP